MLVFAHQLHENRDFCLYCLPNLENIVEAQ